MPVARSHSDAVTDPARSWNPAAVDAAGADKDTTGAEGSMTGVGAGVLVVGYGSEVRSDDAAGRRVAEAIERRALPGVTVATPTQLVPELAELIASAERVVFVDASVAVSDVTVRRLSPRPSAPGSHHATPDGLLGLVTALALPCPTAFIVEIPVVDLTIGEELSPTTAHAVDRAIDEVLALLRSTG